MPVVNRPNPRPINFRGGGRVRSSGLGYRTAWAGGKYDLRWWHENRTILSDAGQPKTYGALASIRREYSHIVGRSPQLRRAAMDLYAAARKNAGLLRRTGDYKAYVQLPVREKSIEGVPVDYVVWNTDPAAYQIEFGARGVGPSHAMANAAKGLPPARPKVVKRKDRRAAVKRKKR